ncbi:MAG TPA: hypothetical protein VGO50_17325 [Pyrinomonadaceae bacterium]|jgi:hypothetical protein|nr:hypothetical protein [Pyrinomonadaceae bacterium]
MNPQLRTAKRNIEDTWLCRNCEERIIPFEKKPGGVIAEGIIFFIGLFMLLFISLILGGIVMMAALLIAAVRNSKTVKVCPSCESQDIIPSTSKAAKKVGQKSSSSV